MAHSQLNLRSTVPSSIACIYDSNLNKYYQKQRKGNTNGGKALDKKMKGMDTWTTWIPNPWNAAPQILKAHDEGKKSCAK